MPPQGEFDPVGSGKMIVIEVISLTALEEHWPEAALGPRRPVSGLLMQPAEAAMVVAQLRRGSWVSTCRRSALAKLIPVPVTYVRAHPVQSVV